ncbi:MAG: 4Fe-4S binding protein [Proteobacteria bacterium]|nr:4Fe-4S binding protein [Desulfobulbaceae bacterium]MBU4152980.1 4Fe-4S binding protein [Pseudomonadota bacterium]
MLHKTLSFFILLIMGLTQVAFAGGDQPEPSQGQSFRIGANHLQISVQPEHFSSGVTPEIIVTVTNHQTGAAVLNADILVQFALVASHDMANMAPAPTTTSIPHNMADMSNQVVATPPTEEEGGLDFGEPPPVDESIDLSGFKPLASRQQAGSFSISYPISKPGGYTLTLAVRALSGTTYPAPILTDTTIDYQPPSLAYFYRTLFSMGLVLLTLIVAILILAMREGTTEIGARTNLLDIPWIKKFVRSSWYQPLFQIPTLIVFAIIIYIGLVDVQKGDQNIATLLTWTIWWAGIIFTFVLVGRVWCMMCPFGAAQDWLGRRFSLGRSFPRPLRNIWLSTILFLALTWWDSYSGIVNNPAMTAWLMIIFLVTSIVTALVYKDRSFCRYICPLGGLIGLYSMVSPVELRSRALEVCRKDTEKGCIHGTDHSHGCPMFETPMTLARNNYCNFCGECVKGCGHNNIVLRFRAFGSDLWGSTRGHMDEAYLAMVLVGLTILVTAEMIAPWQLWIDAIIKALPLADFGVVSHAGQEKFVFTLLFGIGALMVPALLLFLISALVKKIVGTDHNLTIKEIFIRFAYMLIPVGLSMHLAHNVTHLLREGVEVVPALQGTVQRLSGSPSNNELWQVAPLMGLESLFWLQMVTIILLNGLSLYAGYRIAKTHFGDKAWRAFVPMALLAVGFMLINVFILGQPMALRHNH